MLLDIIRLVESNLLELIEDEGAPEEVETDRLHRVRVKLPDDLDISGKLELSEKLELIEEL